MEGKDAEALDGFNVVAEGRARGSRDGLGNRRRFHGCDRGHRCHGGVGVHGGRGNRRRRRHAINSGDRGVVQRSGLLGVKDTRSGFEKSRHVVSAAAILNPYRGKNTCMDLKAGPWLLHAANYPLRVPVLYKYDVFKLTSPAAPVRRSCRNKYTGLIPTDGRSYHPHTTSARRRQRRGD